MSAFQQLRKYLNWRKPIKSVPRQYIIDTTDLQDATPDQTMLVQAGVARNARQAQWMMDHHHVSRAVDLLKLMPRRKINRRARIVRLLMKWQRVTPDPLRFKIHEDTRITVKAKFKDGL